MRVRVWSRQAVMGLAGLALGIGLLAAADAPRAAQIDDSFDGGGDAKGALSGYLLEGEEKGWTGRFDAGSYRLSNPETANAIKYFFVNPQSAPERLDVSVAGDFVGDNAGAGLLYGFDRQAGTYYAFVVTKAGRYGVFRRGAQGIQRIAAGSNDAIRSDGENLLSIHFQGGMVQHFVNDFMVMSFGSKNPIEGSVGLVALDRGSFVFDDFSLTTR